MCIRDRSVASADMVSISELHQQAEAVGRWTQTYEAHGRTIEVDVPIIVPEVEKLPVVEVEAYYAIRNDRLNRENYPLKRLYTYDEKEEYKNYIIYEETNLDTYLNLSLIHIYFTDLYVNAQTGEVITDKLTRIAQEVCPRVITWEDAQ